MRRLLVLILTFCLLVPMDAWAANPANPATNPAGSAIARKLDVEGRGVDEQAALKDAFRNAVESAVGVMVSSETEVSNFQTVRDRIFTHAEGYVSSYRITDRYQHADGAVGLRVSVVITEQSIHDDLVALQVLQMQVGNPVLVVSYDPKGPRHAMTGLAVDRMKAYLSAKGISYLQAPEASAGDVARRSLADAYVVITADLRETRRSGDWRFVKARVQISAHDGATGRGLGSETGYSRELAMRSGAMSGYEAATEEAVGDAAERIMKRVLAHWRTEAAKGRGYRVTLRGVTGYEQQKRFTEILKETGREVRLEASGGGEAAFTVWSRDPLDQVLDRVMTGAKRSALKLELVRQEPGRIDLRLAPSGP